MAVVACITSGSSRDQLVMHLLRSLWLISAHYQFDACAIHIPGQKKCGCRCIVQKSFDPLLISFTTGQPCPISTPRPMDQHVAHPETQLGLTRLDELAKDLFIKGLAPSTTRTYDSAKRRYLTFCQLYHLTPLPLSESILCRFVTFLSTQSLKYQSIKSYLSALRHLQITQGFQDPFIAGMFPRLEYIMKGIRRSPTTLPPRQRLPITPNLLRAIHTLWSPKADNPDSHLLWAACCMAFFGFLRSGELTAPAATNFDPQSTLLLSDIALDSHEAPAVVAVTLERSKTDPFRLGVTLFLGKTGDVVCPVKSLASLPSNETQRSWPSVCISGWILSDQTETGICSEGGLDQYRH